MSRKICSIAFRSPFHSPMDNGTWARGRLTGTFSRNSTLRKTNSVARRRTTATTDCGGPHHLPCAARLFSSMGMPSDNTGLSCTVAARSGSGKIFPNNHISARRIARLSMKISHPEKSWKNPSATFAPQTGYRNPTVAIRRLFVNTVTGIADRTRTARFQNDARKWYAMRIPSARSGNR